MRKGDKAVILFNKRGDIFALSTGADACTEHEWGSKKMQEALSGASVGHVLPEGFVASAAASLGLSKTELREDQLVATMRAGKKVEFAPLLERKTLRHNLDKLVFLRGEEKGKPVAVFGYAPRSSSITLDHRELPFWREEDEVVGAWDEETFAWKVRGQRLVDKLERFVEKVRAGDGVFAGTFLKEVHKESLSGVMLALKSDLRPEHRTAIATAQATWEGDQLLKAMSRTDEMREVRHERQKVNSRACLPGHIWPFWKGNVVGGEVLYRLNPGSGVDAQYGGPYTFEQLKDWIVADKKVPLRPLPEVVSSNQAAAK
jgi:hypothetical protein